MSSAVLFGISVPLTKTLVSNASPILLAGLLYAGSGAGLSLVVLARRFVAPADFAVSLPSRGDLRWLAAAIFFGGVCGPVALMYGLAGTSASTASLLLNLEAVFTALFAWFLFRENFDRRVLLGMAAIVAGGLVLSWAPVGSGRTASPAVLIAIACACWALDNNLSRRVSGSDAMALAAAKGLVAGAVNLGLALLLGDAMPAAAVVEAALVVGFLGYGVSTVLFMLALRHLGAARTSAYFSVAPFFGAALALAIQGDTLTWQFAAAGALMSLGVWLHITERHVHRHTHEPQEHSHPHVHDEHHRHAHPAWDGIEPHTHHHVHSPMWHSHPHYPDLHHRHPH